MGVLDQGGRSLLKRLTGFSNYLTGGLTQEEEDSNAVIKNDILSGGTIDSNSITPASVNQTKQTAINTGKDFVDKITPFIAPIPKLVEEAGKIGATGLNVNTSDADTSKFGPIAPVQIEMPEIGETRENNDFSTIKITQEEINQLKKEEEPPHHESKDLLGAMWEDISGGVKKLFNGDYEWQQEAKMIDSSISGFKMLGQAGMTSDMRDKYKEDIQTLAVVKIGLDSGDYTEEQYGELLEQVRDKYKDSIFGGWLDKDEGKFYGYIDDDIKTAESGYKAQIKLNEINPAMQAEASEKDRQINTATSTQMEKVQQAVKYNSNLGVNSQEFIKDAFLVFNEQFTRQVNAMAPARRVKTQLINLYGTEDTSQYSPEDKAIMDYIEKIEQFFNVTVNNYGDRVSKYPQFADKTTGKIIVPDIIDGVNYHDAVFAGTDFLTDEDYGESAWLGKNNASAIDVIENMSANVATQYSMAHGSGFNKWWTWNQRELRPVGVLINEISQQSFGRVGLGTYNMVASLFNIGNGGNYGYISFDALNQDNTLNSVLNTNNSSTGRLLQTDVARFMEYTPEIVGNTIDVFKLASLPNKIRNASRFRAFLNMGIWKPFKLSKASGQSVWKVLKALGEGEKVAGQGLNDLSKTQRFLRYIASDAVPELVWDQIIDASLSSADTDFGSDMSMVFSLGGTAIGTLGVKMAEAGLFQMGKNGLNMIKQSALDGTVKTSWMDGTVRKVLDTLTDDNLDALIKSRYAINSSQLATWEELKSFTRDFKVVSDTVKAAYNTLSASQKAEITRATKGKIGDQLSLLINQVYGADSQFARRIRQLIADDRTNPADIFKYALGVRGTVEIGGWKSQISLADGTNAYVHGYNERLDTIPGISQTGFGSKLRNGLSEEDLKSLADNGVSWAKGWSTSGNFKKGNNGKYYFTKKGLDSAGDIRSSSLDVALVANVSETADEFDTLIKNSNIKKISDKTLKDIKDSGAYDTLADALAELAWLCGIEF